ncbi:hypothetical protein SCWH03_35930 [Streptomyces pacificus]|uniref:phosphatidyl-myo-inositol dimannoside synthase n=2 Tax=Streptomyces pacificus TaxID=2705029 RepID=A0A6A0AY43_9ACTN|nr:hypothetical protein SCWH03_35930 [Streptomyces pacificus]
MATVTDLGPHRVWGLCATVGYTCAAALALGSSTLLRWAAPFVAAVGAAVVPMVWLVAHRQGQLEVDVVHHSGALLLHTGSPYLPEPGQIKDYNPYLPAMALFGLPYAVLGDHPIADARWWFALVFCLALGSAARTAAGHCAPRALAVLAAFPLLALPLATGGIDLPVTALMCLALATAATGRPAATGLAAGAAAAMKWTAWPVLVVALVLLAVRRGGRVTTGAGAVAAVVIAVLTVPSVLVSPSAFTEQVLLYPLGAGRVASPATSPLPGYLVATLLPGGRLLALVLLALAAVAVAVSLAVRPPRVLLAAADRLALALALAFCLAPATRFGYLLMPLTIAAWFHLHPGPEGLSRGVVPRRFRSVPALHRLLRLPAVEPLRRWPGPSSAMDDARFQRPDRGWPKRPGHGFAARRTGRGSVPGRTRRVPVTPGAGRARRLALALALALAYTVLCIGARRTRFVEPEIQRLREHVSPGAVCLDIGAEYGLYTISLAHLAGPTGTVHSFEPLPGAHRVLTVVRYALGRRTIRLHRTALGRRVGSFTMSLPYRRRLPVHGRAFVTDGALRLGPNTEFAEEKRLNVTVRTVDAAAPARVDFIKADVEGAEAFVLEGAHRTLLLHRPTLLLEIEERHPAKYGLGGPGRHRPAPCNGLRHACVARRDLGAGPAHHRGAPQLPVHPPPVRGRLTMSRTLVVTNDFPPRQGGIETFVHAMVRRFPADRVVVYTSHTPGEAHFDEQQPFPVVRDRTRMLLPTPKATARAVHLARRYDCDSVWFGAAAPLGLMAPALRSRAGVRRLVATTHGHEVWWARTPVARQLLRRIGHHVDALTYLGDYTRRHLATALRPGDTDRLVRLTPGVDAAAFAPRRDDGASLREHYGLGSGPVILCAARLVPRKGQDTLILAMRSLRRRHPGARLLLVGDGPYEGRLRDSAQRSGVAEAVIFAGGHPHEAMPAFYGAADVFAMPSRTRRAGMEVEGLGIVYLEAAAAGLPVVAGDSGGAPDAVRHGETGYVVDGHRPAEVAARLDTLLSDAQLTREMGRRGQAWVSQQWSWDEAHQKLTKYLDQGISGTP